MHKLRWTWDRRAHVWRCDGRPDLRVSPAFARNDDSRVPIQGLRRSAPVLDGWTLTPGGEVFQDYHLAMLAAEGVKTRNWQAVVRAQAKAEKKAQQARRAS